MQIGSTSYYQMKQSSIGKIFFSLDFVALVSFTENEQIRKKRGRYTEKGNRPRIKFSTGAELFSPFVGWTFTKVSYLAAKFVCFVNCCHIFWSRKQNKKKKDFYLYPKEIIAFHLLNSKQQFLWISLCVFVVCFLFWPVNALKINKYTKSKST